MQRERVLERTLSLLQQHGLATSLSNIAREFGLTQSQLTPFWPDSEALLYDCLRFHGKQISVWRRQLLLDETLTPQQKLLARYDLIHQQLLKHQLPGCLFLAACSFYPDETHPIHQLAEEQKQASHQYTLDLLHQLNVDDAPMLAQQMELILEGCLSKLWIKRQEQDVFTAKRLAEDLLILASCRKEGALG